jgi:hypothetical protein
VGVDEVWCGGVSAWWVVLRIGGPLVVMDGSGSCAGVISAMGGYEVELCGGGGFTWRMRADGVWCVWCVESLCCRVDLVCVCGGCHGRRGAGGGMMTMVAVAGLSCGGGGSVSDGEQGCEDDGFRVQGPSRGGGAGGGDGAPMAVAVAAGCVRPGGGVANASVGPAVIAARRDVSCGEHGRQGRR